MSLRRLSRLALLLSLSLSAQFTNNNTTPSSGIESNGNQASGTAGQAGYVRTNNASSYLAFEAEL